MKYKTFALLGKLEYIVFAAGITSIGGGGRRGVESIGARRSRRLGGRDEQRRRRRCGSTRRRRRCGRGRLGLVCARCALREAYLATSTLALSSAASIGHDLLLLLLLLVLLLLLRRLAVGCGTRMRNGSLPFSLRSGWLRRRL